MPRCPATAASAAVADIGWRYLLDDLAVSVPVRSLAQGSAVVAAAVAAGGARRRRPPAGGPAPGPGGAVRPGPAGGRRHRARYGAGPPHRRRRGRPRAGRAGSTSAESPRPVQALEVAIDALDIPAIQPFWKAVLGYVDQSDAGDPSCAIVDPAGQLPALWFQQMDAPRPQRNRVHFDITVAHDEAEPRVRAALAAGGRLVDDSHARAFWVLADAEGNEVCVCTWTDRDEREEWLLTAGVRDDFVSSLPSVPEVPRRRASMSVDEQDTRAFYTQPATMTSLGEQAPLVKALPGDPGVLAAALHGLVIHEHMTGGYGVTLAEADRWTVHVRPAADLLAEIVARDPRPLDQARSPEGRVPGNCRHFTVLEAAMLRAHGTPARARCGFGGYFGTGWFEDHWVTEYWDSGQQRWRLIDAQIDDVQQGWFHTEFDADRRAQGPVPGRRGGVAAVPGRRGRPGEVRAQPAAGGRRLVDRRQPDARRRGPAQHRAAALGLLGRDADAGGHDRRRPGRAVRPAGRGDAGARRQPAPSCDGCTKTSGCGSRRRSATPSAAARSRSGPRVTAPTAWNRPPGARPRSA